jgi:formylglycine-generating enzyme required for sulfatase activity
MSGNVREWCWDLSTAGDRRVSRGGSWGSDERDLRSAIRYIDWPGYGNGRIGFRLSRP